MTDPELFDTSNVRDEAHHWDALASRVTAEAIKRHGSVLQWLADSRAAAVAIAVMLGALAILLTTTENVQGGTNAREQWTRALAPSDAVGRTIASANRPPTVGQLLDDARGTGK